MQDPVYVITPEDINKEYTLALSSRPNFDVNGLRYTEITLMLGPLREISKYKCIGGHPTLVLIPADGSMYKHHLSQQHQ